VTHSQRLRAKIQMARGELDSAAFALWTHPRLPEVYPEFLFRSHAIIRASVPLMQAAADECAKRLGSDPVAEPMLAYLTRHIPEETGHDEWVLDDLEVMGVAREQALARVPPTPVAALAGAQYYWIRHVHPVALLAYIAVLEGTPPDIEYFEAIADRAGIPRRAFSNLFLHGKLDPRHRQELDDALDEWPLTETHHALMGISAFQTLRLLAQTLEEAVQSVAGRSVETAGVSR
jgi:hypothetical protein